MRFRTEQHLRRSGEIRSVRETGSRVDSRAFTLWWKRRETVAAAPTSAHTPRTDVTRVCVIASTAAIGGAVRRNRAKRRLREAFRHQQDSAPRGCDLLLIARRAVIDLPMADVERNFAEACRRIPAAADTR